jgi:Taurine catabolism dioxygenase TauD, TfdA family
MNTMILDYFIDLTYEIDLNDKTQYGIFDYSIPKIVELNTMINNNGFCIVKSNITECEELLLLIVEQMKPTRYTKVFDTLIQCNPERGIIAAYSNSGQPLHTDGLKNFYPSFILTAALCTSNYGGENILVSGVQVYNYFYSLFGNQILKDSNITYTRTLRNGEIDSFEKPIFEFIGEDKIINYVSTIVTITGTDFAVELYQLVHDYIHSKNNQIQISLEVGEILIIKNSKILHSRNAFEPNSNRKYRSIWIE